MRDLGGGEGCDREAPSGCVGCVFLFRVGIWRRHVISLLSSHGERSNRAWGSRCRIISQFGYVELNTVAHSILNTQQYWPTPAKAEGTVIVTPSPRARHATSVQFPAPIMVILSPT